MFENTDFTKAKNKTQRKGSRATEVTTPMVTLSREIKVLKLLGISLDLNTSGKELDLQQMSASQGSTGATAAHGFAHADIFSIYQGFLSRKPKVDGYWDGGPSVYSLWQLGLTLKDVDR